MVCTPGSRANSGHFEITLHAMTRERCSPTSMDESIAAHSQYIRSYILHVGKLYFSLLADAGINVWQREEFHTTENIGALSPEDGGPLNWEVITGSGGLNLRQQPLASSRIISTIPGGVILDNLGCRETAGRAWCYVQQFGGGPVGHVDAAFLKPAVSPSGAVITGPDDSALRAGQGDFDATGAIPCAQYRRR